MLLPDESSRAAGLDPLRKLLVVLRTGEDNRKVGTEAGHGVTDREGVVVAKMDVDQHASGSWRRTASTALAAQPASATTR